MNKSDLIAQIAKETNLTQKRVGEILDAILESIIEVVKESGSITFTNFGKFEKRLRKERKGVNPKTGDLILIPPKEVFIFKPSKNIFKTE
ncbi:MAG: HU family DNA-binding protein [Ignavibacteria bacterium]|jgi:nucleoid DNA-binding protein|nr:HU family DNA-binding protein [Ignavibacteria bacterium]MDH7526625.1 HU family DNA-binding protein [Ignavibacteria bacterium]NPV11461.1 HU family DNA-binding protein [Ignavibacteria bacterium]